MSPNTVQQISIESHCYKWLGVALLIILLDQISKGFAELWLLQGHPYPVMPSFNFTLWYNTGAAFSLLSEAGGWQRWFFIIVTIVVCGILWFLLKQLKPGESGTAMSATGMMLIMGGALGNLVDRLFRGAVVDFLDFYYQSYHWPTFNIADIAITIGALMIIIVALGDKASNLK